jgi:uncharacterized protein YqeY
MSQNTAAEFHLLSALCQHPDLYFEISEFLSTSDFTQKAHKHFFIVLQRLLLDADAENDILVTEGQLLAKAAELNIKDFYTTCDNGELIRACIQQTCSRADVIKSFKQVKRETVRRTLTAEAKDIVNYLDDTDDAIDKVITTVEDRILSTSNKLQGATESPIIHLTKEALDILEDLAEHPGELGLHIGLPTWQKGIGGIRNGAVSFIASSTKMGKSQMGVRAAIEAAKMGIPALICDSELNKLAQSVRAFGQFAEINYEILETGYWKSTEDNIRAAGYNETFVHECKIAKKNIQNENIRKIFKDLPIYYHSINSTTAREALPFLRRWIMQHVGVNPDSRVPRCLIVWDYVKLARVEEVRHIGVGAHDILAADCSALHDFAEKYNLPILAFGQTNRQIDESLDCIAGAKKITELCDSVSLYKEKSPEELNMDSAGSHLMKVFVTRYGKGIKTHINLDVDLSIGKFIDLGVHIPRTIQNNNNDDNETNNEQGADGSTEA